MPRGRSRGRTEAECTCLKSPRRVVQHNREVAANGRGQRNKSSQVAPRPPPVSRADQAARAVEAHGELYQDLHTRRCLPRCALPLRPVFISSNDITPAVLQQCRLTRACELASSTDSALDRPTTERQERRTELRLRLIPLATRPHPHRRATMARQAHTATRRRRSRATRRTRRRGVGLHPLRAQVS